MIHCWSASPTSRSARIFGSATLTIVPSTNTTAEPRMQAIRVSRLARASTPWRLACRVEHGSARRPDRQPRRRRRPLAQAASGGRGRAASPRHRLPPRGDEQPGQCRAARARGHQVRRGGVHARRGRARRCGGGRGNDFARVLGVPRDPAEAGRALARAEVRRLDLGEAGGRPFIGIASCGFDSDANRIANEARHVKGQAVYAYAALRALAAWKPARFELVLDGDSSRTYVGWSVGACNSKAYGGGMYAAPDAELDDGLLDVVVCERTSKATFVTRILPGLFPAGTHVKLPQVHCMRAREVHISSDRPFALYADGDPVGDLPITVRIRPGAIAVLVP